MRTISQLQREIKELKDEQERLYNLYSDLEVRELAEKLENRKRFVSKEREPRISEVGKRIWELEKEVGILRVQNKDKRFKPSEGLKKWLEVFFRGIENGEKNSIFWATEDERFVIVHVPGGMCWAGRGAPEKYYQSEYRLYDRKWLEEDNGTQSRALSHMYILTGRMTKKVFEDMKEMILQRQHEESAHVAQ